MWIYFAVIALIIMNCIGFYKDKILIWSVPIMLVVFKVFEILIQWFLGDYNSVFDMFNNYGSKIIYDLSSQFFIISIFSSLITIIIRYKKSKKSVLNLQQNEED